MILALWMHYNIYNFTSVEIEIKKKKVYQLGHYRDFAQISIIVR